MLYGWKGKILRVDLAKGKAAVEDLPEEWREKYMGCRGINDIILYNEVGPDVEAFSGDNKLIFGTGPLDGTPAGPGRLSVQTKHPYKFIAEGGAGGYWAPELKFAGYDFIVIENKSPEPVYILVDDDFVAIRPASHLWGKDIKQKHAMLREETGIPGIQVLSIGPAGERLVFDAKIGITWDHSGGKGCGTVMGDKKLAAVAVHGTGGVHVKHPDKFWEAYKDLTRIWDLKDTIDPFTPAYAFNSANMLLELFNENGWVHAYNAQKSSFQPMMNDVEYLDRYIQRPQACFCCPFPACGRRFKMEDSKYGTITGDEREVGFAAACIDAGISSWPVALKFRDLCNRAGADEHQMLYTITWAMECYEKGIINKKDTDGVDLRFGNAEAFLTITERIIAREGFGDVLANGAYKAAEIVGKGSDRYALTIKGKELEGMPQRNGYQMALALAVCEGGPDHTRWYPPYPPNPKALPKLTTVPFDLEKSFQTRSVEDKGRLVKWLYVRSAIIESLPTCVYLVRGILGIDLSPWLNIYNACTGADCGLQEFTAIGERIVNLERSYIVREGFRRKDDTLPRRMMEEPIAEINIPPVGGNLDLMLDDYYTQMGWDVKTAIPKADTLSKLGLDFVAEDFKNRGISVG